MQDPIAPLSVQLALAAVAGALLLAAFWGLWWTGLLGMAVLAGVLAGAGLRRAYGLGVVCGLAASAGLTVLLVLVILLANVDSPPPVTAPQLDPSVLSILDRIRTGRSSWGPAGRLRAGAGDRRDAVRGARPAAGGKR